MNQLAYLSFIVEPWKNELPLKWKRVKKMTQINQFSLKDSVFKDWKIPTDTLIEKSLRIDFDYSKLFWLLKQDKDKDEVFQVLKTYARKIMDVFTYQSSKSTYPSISWLDFSNWVNQIHTYDQHCKVNDVDRIFIQTNVELIE